MMKNRQFHPLGFIQWLEHGDTCVPELIAKYGISLEDIRRWEHELRSANPLPLDIVVKTCLGGMSGAMASPSQMEEDYTIFEKNDVMPRIPIFRNHLARWRIGAEGATGLLPIGAIECTAYFFDCENILLLPNATIGVYLVSHFGTVTIHGFDRKSYCVMWLRSNKQEGDRTNNQITGRGESTLAWLVNSQEALIELLEIRLGFGLMRPEITCCTDSHMQSQNGRNVH